MKSLRGNRRPKPQHARPSVLAPSRAVATVGGLATVAVTLVAGCAAVAGGQAGAAGPARPSVARAPLAAPGALTAQGSVLAPRLGVADFGLAATSGTPRVTGPKPAGPAPDAAPASGLASSGIPSTALAAYKAAATRGAGRAPACGITWPLLAAIGRVESNHGRFAGAVLHSDGVSTPPIIGIPLNGHGTALIRDTDDGRLDGDTVYDRAVGPMQFIPSTWAGWGVDADHDGVKNPFDVFDAAAAAADYLCAAGGDLTTTRGQVRAILSYNYSYDYVSMVMALERIYAAQVGVTVPVLPTTANHGRPHEKPSLPPVDPGTPGGLTSPTSTKRSPTVTHTSSSSPPSSSAPTSSSPPSSSAPSSSPPSSSAPSSSTGTTPAQPPATAPPTTPTPDCPTATPTSPTDASSSPPPADCPTSPAPESSAASASDAPAAAEATGAVEGASSS